MSSNTRPCAQCAPNLAASRSPFHVAGGCGAFQRRSPTGGAAYGSPRNARTFPSLIVFPVALPCSVFTVNESAFKLADSPINNPAAAKAHKACERKNIANSSARYLISTGSAPQQFPLDRTQQALGPSDPKRVILSGAAWGLNEVG